MLLAAIPVAVSWNAGAAVMSALPAGRPQVAASLIYPEQKLRYSGVVKPGASGPFFVYAEFQNVSISKKKQKNLQKTIPFLNNGEIRAIN